MKETWIALLSWVLWRALLYLWLLLGNCEKFVKTHMSMCGWASDMLNTPNDTCGIADSYSEPLLQPLWDHMRERQILLQSPLLTASTAFTVHFFFCAPYLVLDLLGDRVPWIHTYRIESKAHETFDIRKWLDCLGRIFLKYLTGILPCIAFFQSLREISLPEEAPSCFLAVTEVIMCLLLFDTFFFMWHMIMHR